MGSKITVARRMNTAIRRWAAPAGTVLGIFIALSTLMHMSIEYIVSDNFQAVADEFRAVHERIDAVERRLDNLEHRMDALERRMDVVERRLDALEHRIDDLERRFDARMDEMGETLARIEGIVTSMRDSRDADAEAQAAP